MRAAAMSVWVFINLLCFGMCGYLYLIWSQYWLYIEKQRLLNKSPDSPHRTGVSGLSDQDTISRKFDYNIASNSSSLRLDSVRKRSVVGSFWNSGKLVQRLSSNKSSGTNIIRKSNGSPRFPNIHQPILELDSEKYSCDDFYTSECEARTSDFKESLLKEFHRVLMTDSKVFRSGLDSQNQYDVRYHLVGRRKELTGAEVLCALRRVALRTVLPTDEPFARLGFRFPRRSLRQAPVYNTCAVVTSAGALLGSRLGEFIDKQQAATHEECSTYGVLAENDSHDMVLRFNNAPTENYTEDVGYKTTFRVLNSQVVTKPEFRFLENSLFRGVTILIWDPANYSSTLEEWYHDPDFPLFPVYKKLFEQRSDADVHLLNPQVLWELWAVLQDSSPYRLRRNPPSSGFIGIWLSLHRCRRVRVFEYVPSVRVTRRCHYHATHDDPACTLGAWHPLAQEKALAERMRDNSDLDVFQRGFVDIPGFRNITCRG